MSFFIGDRQGFGEFRRVLGQGEDDAIAIRADDQPHLFGRPGRVDGFGGNRRVPQQRA